MWHIPYSIFNLFPGNLCIFLLIEFDTLWESHNFYQSNSLFACGRWCYVHVFVIKPEWGFFLFLYEGWSQGSPALSSFLCNHPEGSYDSSEEEGEERQEKSCRDRKERREYEEAPENVKKKSLLPAIEPRIPLVPILHWFLWRINLQGSFFSSFFVFLLLFKKLK